MAEDGTIRIELPIEVVNEDGLSQVIGDAITSGTQAALRTARREVQSFQNYIKHAPLEFKATDIFKNLSKQSAGLLTEEFARTEGAIVDVNSMADAVYDNILRWVGGAEEFAAVVNKAGHSPESFQEFINGFASRAVDHVVASFKTLQGLRPVIADRDEYELNRKISDVLDKIIEKRKQLSELQQKQNQNYDNPLATMGTQTWANTEKEIANTKKEMADLLREAQGLGVQSQDLIEYLPEGFRLASNSAQQFEGTLGQISSLIVRLFPNVQGLSAILGDIQNIFSEVSKTVDTNGEQISQAIMQLDESTEDLASSAATAGQSFGPWGAIAGLIIDAVVIKINQLQRRAQIAFNVVRKLIEVSLMTLQKFGQAVSWVGNLFGKLIKSVFNAFKNIPKVMSNIKSFFTNILKHANRSRFSFGRLFQTLMLYGIGIRSLSSLFLKFRSTIIDGFKDISKYSARFNQAMTNLTSTWNQLKGQISAIFEPLVSRLAPLLEMIIAKLNEAALAVTRFFGAFFGYAKVLKATKVVKDYANAVGGANKQLAGFDELNNLSSNSGGGSDDIGNGWEWVDSAPEFLDLWQKLKDTWTQEFPDFSWFGRMIADKLSELMESIPWSKIYKVAYKSGFGIGTFLDGFFTDDAGDVDTRFFDNLGKTIARGMNTVVNFIQGFIKGFDFGFFGEALGSGFTSMVNTIQWRKLANIIITGLQGVLDTVSNFLNTIADSEKGINVKEIVTAIEMTIKGIFTDLTKFVNETHWDDLKNKVLEFFDIDVNAIAKKISEFVSSVQQQNILGKFKEVLLSALGTAGDTETENTGIAGFINSLIANTDITQLILDVVDFCVTIGKRITENAATIAQTLAESIDWKVILTELFNVLDSIELISYDSEGNVDGGIVTAVLNFVETSLSKIPARRIANIANTCFEKILGSLLIAFSDFNPDNTDANPKDNFILNWIKELINGIDLDNILGAMVDLSERIGEFLGTVLDDTNANGAGVKLLAALMVIGKNIILGIIKGINDFVFPEESPFHAFFDWVVDSIKKVFGIASPATEMEPYGAFITEGILVGIQSKFSAIITVFENLKKQIGEKFEGIKSNIKLKMSEMTQHLLEKFTHWKDVAEEKLTTIKNNLSTKFDEMKQKVVDTFTAIKNTFDRWRTVAETTIANVKAAFSNRFTEISTKATTVFENIKTNATNAFEGIKTAISQWHAFIEGKLALVKATFETKFNGIKDSMRQTFEGIKEVIRTPINSVIGLVEGMVNSVIAGFNSLASSLNRLKLTPPAWITEKFGIGAIGFKLPTFSQIRIPRLAQGAVIPPNHEFMAVLGDQKHGTNVETPLSTMVEAFNTALSQNGNSENMEALMRTQISLLQIIADKCGLSDRDIANSIKRSNAECLKRTGNNLLAY